MTTETNLKSYQAASVSTSTIVEQPTPPIKAVDSVVESAPSLQGLVEAQQISVSVPSLNTQQPASISVAAAIVSILEQVGVKYAFGVAGGAMATLWAALSSSDAIQVVHCRHEAGAAFAATEAYFASDRPVAVFSTAGPGITNALTGLLAARGEGAKVIHLSACTSAPQRGRWAIQETSTYTMPQADIFTSGTVFHYAITLESVEQLPQIARRLALGFAQPGSFVAHISIPTGIQSSTLAASTLPHLEPFQVQTVPSPATIAHCAQLLSAGPFAIWLGFGARHGAAAIHQLAEQTGAAVMCSPRGKGIFPEDHPQFVGVTGLGGHESVLTYMQRSPLYTLVLGTRLGEPTSFWSSAMVPLHGFIHVDIDPDVPGVAYPLVHTLPVQSDVKTFVEALLPYLASYPDRATMYPRPTIAAVQPDHNGLVRPAVLMDAIQQYVVEASEAIVLAESGNSFTWATNRLRFSQPNRYRVSTGVGSMGHTTTGVIGAALGGKRKAVAIVGDGAMLMNNEISTAVKYQIPAIWIVLNDARYGMCAQGMSMLGMEADSAIPPTDFVAIARGMGANGMRIDRESDLETAFTQALAAPGPFVVDVLIDPTQLAPSKGRNQSLVKQGTQTKSGAKQISFPLV